MLYMYVCIIIHKKVLCVFMWGSSLWTPWLFARYYRLSNGVLTDRWVNNGLSIFVCILKDDMFFKCLHYMCTIMMVYTCVRIQSTFACSGNLTVTIDYEYVHNLNLPIISLFWWWCNHHCCNLSTIRGCLRIVHHCRSYMYVLVNPCAQWLQLVLVLCVYYESSSNIFIFHSW